MVVRGRATDIIKALHRALREIDADRIAIWLDAGQGAPVPRAAVVLEDRPRDPAAALILADTALAQALGWTHVVPLLAFWSQARRSAENRRGASAGLSSGNCDGSDLDDAGGGRP